MPNRNRNGMLPYFVPPRPTRPTAEDPFYYLRLRNELPRESPLHAVLGPLEHGQFVEDLVLNDPLMAVPMAAAIPAYTAGKATGMIPGTRSPASWDEIFEAYKGLWRGLFTPRPQRPDPARPAVGGVRE